MKYPLLSALLAVSTIDLHSNLFGNKKPVAKLNEEQLQLIEDGLEAKQNSDPGLEDLQSEVTSAQDALSEALTINNITMPDGASLSEAIALLGTTCKTYGEKGQSHTSPPNDGIDREESNTENFAFEAVLNDTSKFQILKK